MTVAQARTLFLRYVGPAGTSNADFLAALNHLRKRFFDSGKWKGLTLEITITPASGVVTLPDTCESILGAQFDDRPVVVFGRYHEFQPGGPGEIDAANQGVPALIDNGDRTYKMMGNYTDVESVRVVCKRRYTDLTADSDVVYPDNPGALKLGLMSLKYEDENDLERAVEYFAQALNLLNGEVREARGASQHTLQQSPHGFAIQNGGIRRPY